MELQEGVALGLLKGNVREKENGWVASERALDKERAEVKGRWGYSGLSQPDAVFVC